MDNSNKKQTAIGLGDQVEKLIKKNLPRLAEKYKGCKSCKNRKKFLNNFNAVFG